MKSWYWHKEKESFPRGPVDENELTELYSSGKLILKDRVWKEGFDDWMEVSKVSFIRSTPPPIFKTKPLFIPPDDTKLPDYTKKKSKQNLKPIQNDIGEITVNSKSVKSDSPENTDLKGIGGWLLFFCVFAAILTPISSIRNIVEGFAAYNNFLEFDPLFASIILLEVVLAISVVIFGIIVGTLIWNSHNRGKVLAIQYLVLRLSTTFLVSIALIITDLSQEMDLMSFQAIFLTLLIEFSIFIVWYAYFKKSKRVANTFSQINKNQDKTGQPKSIEILPPKLKRLPD